jgi:methyl-accepting chemotaxis protein
MMNKITIDDFTTTWGDKLYMKVILIHQWVSVLIFLCIAIVFANILTNSLITSYNNSLSGVVELVGSRIQTGKDLSFNDRGDIPANITGLYVKHNNIDKKLFDSNNLDSTPYTYKVKVLDKDYTITVFATSQIDQIRFIRCNIMLVTIFIILLFSNLIKRTTDAILTKPLNSFMDFIRVLQSGNINIRLHPIRNDEFGELGKCLDDLLDENSSLLEKQVLTEKLKDTNAELQHNIDISS